MRLAILADPLERFRIEEDSTYAILREAQGRGWGCFCFEQRDMWIAADGSVQAVMRELRLRDAVCFPEGVGSASPAAVEPLPWFTEHARTAHRLADFDAVLMRKDPPFDTEYLYATHLLEAAERQGAHVFNRPRALRDFNEKLSILRFPQLIAPTLVSSQPKQLRAFLREQGDIILKPLDGMAGMGIYRLREDDPNLGVIFESQTARGTRTVMVQRYLPEIAQGDRRILIFQGTAVPAAWARFPAPGETRANVEGARGAAQPLSAREREIVATLAPVLCAEGLLLVGIDVIGGCLTEINVTSPTCFQDIERGAGLPVSAQFCDALCDALSS